MGGVAFTQNFPTADNKTGAWVCDPGTNSLIAAGSQGDGPKFGGLDSIAGLSEISISKNGKFVYFSSIDGKINWFNVVDDEPKAVDIPDDLGIDHITGIEVSQGASPKLFIVAVTGSESSVTAVKIHELNIGDDGAPSFGDKAPISITDHLKNTNSLNLGYAAGWMSGPIKGMTDEGGQLHVALSSKDKAKNSLVIQYNPTSSIPGGAVGYIPLETVGQVKGLTFGGKQGSQLFAMGTCREEETKGCIDSTEDVMVANAPGFAIVAAQGVGGN